MGFLKRIITLCAAVSTLGALSCGKEALLSNLETNQLMVIFKGTYESNSPMDWAMPDVCQATGTRPDGTTACAEYTVDHLDEVQDDSVVICNGRDAGSPFGKDDSNPVLFMVDIAEMVLMDYNGNKHKFSNYRQTYAFAINDDDPIFNGLGHLLENDDVPSKAYAALGIYVRKMLLDGARNYTADYNGWSSSVIWDVFAEDELPCYNFNRFQTHSYYDTLRLESAYINRVYPIIIPISNLQGMIFSNKFPVTVLEVRLVVKNFLKKYEVVNITSGINNVVHFYGFSDWLQDVQVDDTEIGGNLLAVARWYIPGLTGRISGTHGGSDDAHVIAIPYDEARPRQRINQYTIPYDPYSGTSAGNPRSNNPANFPRAPAFALGLGIQSMLEYYSKLEKYKYNWNQQLTTFQDDLDDWNSSHPDPLDQYTSMGYYGKLWDTFSQTVSGFKIPELATFVPAGGQYTIENVMPGRYDVYISLDAPEYGKLYYEGRFNYVGTVDVSPGSNSTPVLVP